MVGNIRSNSGAENIAPNGASGTVATPGQVSISNRVNNASMFLTSLVHGSPEFTLKNIAGGKVKDVHIITNISSKDVIVASQGREVALSQTVVYTAKKGVVSALLNKNDELRSESALMKELNKKCKDTSHLAVEVLTESDLGKRMAIMVERAECGDFEKFLAKDQVTVKIDGTEHLLPITEGDKKRLAGEFFKGLQQLHQAGYAYGDLKPENCLVYLKKDATGQLEKPYTFTLKIADFGKTQAVAEGQVRAYKGNPRFEAPEGVLSKKADVAGAALIMARCLEELVAPGKLPRVSNADIDRQNSTKSGRRGIERFICEHKAFSAIDVPVSLKLLDVSRRNQMAGHQGKESGLSQVVRQRQEEVKVKYFKEMSQILVDEGKITDKQKVELDKLFEDMSKTDPDARITMTEAIKRYEAINL